MNWGKAIVLVFIVFAGFIGTMVVRMSRQRIDLVRDDYYQDEMAYQQHIDRVSRTARLNHSPMLPIDTARQQLDLALPVSSQQASVTFYCPADRRQDRTIILKPGERTVSTEALAKGLWRVQLNWSVEGQPYYYEQLFTKP